MSCLNVEQTRCLVAAWVASVHPLLLEVFDNSRELLQLWLDSLPRECSSLCLQTLARKPNFCLQKFHFGCRSPCPNAAGCRWNVPACETECLLASFVFGVSGKRFFVAQVNWQLPAARLLPPATCECNGCMHMDRSCQVALSLAIAVLPPKCCICR